MSNQQQTPRVSGHDIMAFVAMECRKKVVEALLQGNDTQCFSTAQYAERYHNDIDKGVFGNACKKPDLPLEVAEKHLRSLAGVVREVRPGVWAPAEKGE